MYGRGLLYSSGLLCMRGVCMVMVYCLGGVCMVMVYCVGGCMVGVYCVGGVCMVALGLLSRRGVYSRVHSLGGCVWSWSTV